MVKIDERVKKIYSTLYTSKKRYFFITGGRASLKSTNVQEFIARLTFEQGHGVLFTRYTMTSAEKSIIPEFKNVVNRLGLTPYFDTIDDSIRSSHLQNRVIWIQNPTTKEHFIYKRWIQNTSKQIDVLGYNVTVSDHADVEHIHSTYHLAAKLGFLSEGWIKKADTHKERAEQKHNLSKDHPQYIDKHESHYYYNYIGGWLEREFGAIFTNWSEGEFNLSIPRAFGLDYGYYPDPLGFIAVSVDKRRKKVYLKEFIYSTKLSEGQVITKVKETLIRRNDLVVVDHNEPRLTAALAKAKVNVVKAVKGKDSVIDGIRKMQEYQLIIDPSSHNIKRELNNYVWNDKKQSVPIDEFNHLIDAARYAFGRLTQERAGVRAR